MSATGLKTFCFTLGRSVMMRAQGHRCGICGQPLEVGLKSDAPLAMTAEHVWPKKMGFGLFGNTLLTHSACNNQKADRNPTGCELIFLQAVNRRLGYPEDETRYTDAPWLTERNW